MTMRIAVSAFCLNEAQHVDRWWASVKEADAVVVMDTGSTDGTPERLMALGATVYQKTFPAPFRFDTAGNAALDLVPDDIDLVLVVDLDEVVRPAPPWDKWTDAVRAQWPENATRGWYGYVWNWVAPGRPGSFFRAHRLFLRGAYRWRRPCHPVLEYVGDPASGSVECDMTRAFGILQFSDVTKDRRSYLPLLELGVKEYPDDATALFYLGREQTFHGRWTDSALTLLKYLSHKGATNPDERMAAMRLIAQGCLLQGRSVNAEHWFRAAIGAAPWYREPLVDLAALYATTDEPMKAVGCIDRALRIKLRPVTMYAEPLSWDDDILKEMRARLVRRAVYPPNAAKEA